MSEPVLSRNFDRPEARTLPGYRATGGYEAFRKALGARPRGDRGRGQEGEPPGPGRRGVSDGYQVGVHSAEAHGPRLPRRQRGRGRAGDVQGSLHPRARSARPDRGDAHRGLRDRLPHVLRLRPRRVRPALADLRGGGPGGRGRRPAGGEHPRLGIRSPHRRAPGRGCLHLRRGDGAHLLPRGQEGVAEGQAAVPGDQGRLRPADGGQQRRDAGRGAAHHHARGGMVRGPRVEDPGRDAPLLGVRTRDAPRRLRGVGGDHPPRADRAGGRRDDRARASRRSSPAVLRHRSCGPTRST